MKKPQNPKSNQKTLDLGRKPKEWQRWNQPTRTQHIAQPCSAAVNSRKTDQYICETWWRFGRFVACRLKSRGFDSRSSRHVGTLGKSFTHSVKFRHIHSFILNIYITPLQENYLKAKYSCCVGSASA